MLKTVDIRGAFLNALFTSNVKPIYLRINKVIVPYWILQDPSVAPFVRTRTTVITSRQVSIWVKTVAFEVSPLTAGYTQSINAYSTKTKLTSSKLDK